MQLPKLRNNLTGLSLDEFLASSEKRFATVKQVEIIGEACKHITGDVKQAYPELEWNSINGFRNISIHEYLV
jgi:uncharacterized protein with HEPN domain